LEIDLNEVKDLEVSLTNIHGIILDTRVVRDHSHYALKYLGLDPGIYFVKVQGEERAVIVKVLVFGG
jgi:hypothetical protein